MTVQEFANRLDGREYGSEITPAECDLAQRLGIVVVFGASDDLMEFRGAIHDEESAYEGAEVRVDAAGLLPEWEEVNIDENEAAAYLERKRAGFSEIKAIWHDTGDGPDWTYETTIPHASFRVFDDGEYYCRGIVFRLADVGNVQEVQGGAECSK